MGLSLLETDGKPVETGAKRHVHLKALPKTIEASQTPVFIGLLAEYTIILYR